MSLRLLHNILLLFLLSGVLHNSYGQNDTVSTSSQKIAVNAILEKAQAALQSADYEEANLLLNSATEIAKDSAIYAEAQMVRISYYQNTRQIKYAENAIEELTSYLDKSSTNYAQLLLLQADLLIQTDELIQAKDAISDAQIILAQSPDKDLSVLLKLRQAELDLKIENYNTAQEALNGLIPIFLEKSQFFYAARAQLDLSHIYLENENYDKANSILTECIALAEKYNFNLILKEAYLRYSQVLKINQEFEQSVIYLEKYTDLIGTENSSLTSTASIIEIDKLKKENKALLDSNTEKTKELRGVDTSYILLCVFITLLSLLTLSLFKNNKLRAKSNNVLENKNSALIDERDRAQDAAKIKADFLSTITHELRTPLYAVTGLTHLLLDTKPRNDQKEHLETLQSSGEYLLSLIDNILDFNKLEANKVELEAIPFDLSKRVHDIGSSLKGQATDQNNKLHIQYDNSIPSRLQGDPVKVSQILINLIGNAIKFTKDGDIYIRVNNKSLNADKCLIRFEIEDNGKGISEEKQQAIFENFTQEGSSTTREYGGTGLGLAIVKNLVTLMGSEVILNSEVGRGSKFTFEIWFDVPDSNKFFKENHFPRSKTELTQITDNTITSSENEIQETSPTEANSKEEKESGSDATPPKEEVISTKQATPAELSNKLILVVEDNKINQMITRKILESKNFSCEVANNGLEAVEAVKTAKYDLILMDIHMPIMDGKEATKKIRSFDPEIPIIALTAVTLSESEKDFYEIGFDDIIPKPFKIEEFFEKIQKAFTNFEVL
ncbi:hypothetical protein LX97_00400 [Nonlabens dokdonensis]|uniref:histidine kinase n=2 Tax=Nonlabens dokdonensis TaxID=328515 RepID=L7WA10_NONDD|nr:ATP-binding protein [Nonlabens dokdonensis]AGC75713.1 sensor protein [Nonlabens dokdonensis DSW-6]PZX43400.1 hypothetical protein LX97_00400 [Nonlabens dokdonensis]